MRAKLEVPKGWTKGETLVIRKSGLILILSQEYKPFDPNKKVSPLDIAYIIFKGSEAEEELATFMKWWLA